MGDLGTVSPNYSEVHSGIVHLLDEARRAAARSINVLMTATYWEIGRRIVELEQGGSERAGYGQALLKRLSTDLSAKFGRGFGVDSLESMRLLYQTYPLSSISETLLRKSVHVGQAEKSESVMRNLDISQLMKVFPLSWSHYIHLLDGLPNKVLAAEYQMVLPDANLLAKELVKTQREFEARHVENSGEKVSHKQE